jgi:hypothetical protein
MANRFLSSARKIGILDRTTVARGLMMADVAPTAAKSLDPVMIEKLLVAVFSIFLLSWTMRGSQ